MIEPNKFKPGYPCDPPVEQPIEDSCQTHTHEFLGSTKLAEEGEDRHNHRFAGVTSQVIPVPGGHIHEMVVNSDFLDHLHEVPVRTGLQIPVGNNKHVHYAEGSTTVNDEHCHRFQLGTLIDAPLLPAQECD